MRESVRHVLAVVERPVDLDEPIAEHGFRRVESLLGLRVGFELYEGLH